MTNIPLLLDKVLTDIPWANVRPFDVDKYLELRRAYDRTSPRDVDAREAANAAIAEQLERDLKPGDVWVLDEAWKLFPSTATGDKMPSALREVLAMHRHAKNEAGQSMVICFATQNLMQISRFARDLIDETYSIRKLRSFGLTSRFMVDVYTGAPTGPKPPKALLVRRMSGKYREKIWRYYKSHTKAEGNGSAVDESAVDGRAVFWKSPVWYIGGPVVLLGFALGIWRTYRFFHPPTPERAVADVRDSSRRKSGQAQQQRTGPAWRIVASMQGQGYGVVYLSDGKAWVRLALERDCDKDLDGYLYCRWQGELISDKVQKLPTEPKVISAAQVLPTFDQP